MAMFGQRVTGVGARVSVFKRFLEQSSILRSLWRKVYGWVEGIARWCVGKERGR